ncbi:MAG: hypothetical protein KJ645_10070 [Planctomycetes bacterium]|nr:hypothetical protein [Planctomycetota bacterium]
MKLSDIGLIGSVEAGEMLALRLAQGGYSALLHAPRERETSSRKIALCDSLAALVQRLKRPRILFACLNRETDLDRCLAALGPLLTSEDHVLDTRIAHFLDAERRIRKMASKGTSYLCLGMMPVPTERPLSPSCLMVSGDPRSFRSTRPVLESLTCGEDASALPLEFVGPRGAGYYAQMVFLGLMEAEIQLAAEAYEILRHQAVSPEEVMRHFLDWTAQGKVSRLFDLDRLGTDVTALKNSLGMKAVLRKRHALPFPNRWLIDNASDLGIGVPTFAAVIEAGSETFISGKTNPAERLTDKPVQIAGHEVGSSLSTLERSLLAARGLLVHQALVLLYTASAAYNYRFNLKGLVHLWQAGSPLQSKLLETISKEMDESVDPRPLKNTFPFMEASARTMDEWAALLSVAKRKEISCPALTASFFYGVK